MNDRYVRSNRMLHRAMQSIPLGAQTFSKSVTQFPERVSPHFASHARGAVLVDVDGNEYLDFINGLASVLLGYGDPEVDAAIRHQLERGITFSLSHELEYEVAERLIRLVPCAEQVRFGKNGSDATTAAIRLARAYTGRDRVAVCGYHGWQDWYIGTTSRDLGVPQSVKELSHVFRYNDAASLSALFEAHENEFAAVILEPLGAVEPEPGFLESVARETRQAGALLIFDETVTGMRVHLGGAQALTGVVPDLATFGKGLANGMPLSAVLGRKEYMSLMEEIFFSTTFGGETLSLAAAKAVIDRLERDDIPNRLGELGATLVTGIREILDESGLTGAFSVSGPPAWSFLNVHCASDELRQEVRTLLLQELFKHGILSLGTHTLSAAHTSAHIERLLETYRALLPWIATKAAAGEILECLETKPLRPLFSVR